MRAALALLVLTGCKQLFGIEDAMLADDGGILDDEGGGDDAGPTECFADWIDGSVQLGVATSIVSDAEYVRAPHISVDELTVWYQGYTGAELATIRRATRSSRTAAFGNGVVAPDLTSDTGEYDVSLTADELTVVVSSDREGPPASIYYGQRTAANQMFGTLTTPQVATLNTLDKDEFDASLSPDGLEIFSTRVVNGVGTISVATRTSRTGNFGPSTGLDLGGGNTDFAPTIASNSRVLIFESQRTGPPRLYYAVRPARSQDFGVPRVVPFTAPGVDRDGMLSADGCTLYFARAILGGGGAVVGAELFAAPVVR